MSDDDLRRIALEARVAADDLDAILRDALRRPRHRELGPKLHREHAREAYKKLIARLDLILRATNNGGAPPPPPPSEGGPTLH